MHTNFFDRFVKPPLTIRKFASQYYFAEWKCWHRKPDQHESCFSRYYSAWANKWRFCVSKIRQWKTKRLVEFRIAFPAQSGMFSRLQGWYNCRCVSIAVSIWIQWTPRRPSCTVTAGKKQNTPITNSTGCAAEVSPASEACISQCNAQSGCRQLDHERHHFHKDPNIL